MLSCWGGFLEGAPGGEGIDDMVQGSLCFEITISSFLLLPP